MSRASPDTVVLAVTPPVALFASLAVVLADRCAVLGAFRMSDVLSVLSRQRPSVAIITLAGGPVSIDPSIIDILRDQAPECPVIALLDTAQDAALRRLRHVHLRGLHRPPVNVSAILDDIGASVAFDVPQNDHVRRALDHIAE